MRIRSSSLTSLIRMSDCSLLVYSGCKKVLISLFISSFEVLDISST